MSVDCFFTLHVIYGDRSRIVLKLRVGRVNNDFVVTHGRLLEWKCTALIWLCIQVHFFESILMHALFSIYVILLLKYLI